MAIVKLVKRAADDGQGGLGVGVDVGVLGEEGEEEKIVRKRVKETHLHEPTSVRAHPSGDPISQNQSLTIHPKQKIVVVCIGLERKTDCE